MTEKSDNLCPDCGDILSYGMACGGQWIRYLYCEKCDKFVVWQSSVMTEERKRQLQHFVRSTMGEKRRSSF